MSAFPIRFYTPQQYLELEQKAAYKSEYWDGRIYAMAGGSPRHSEAGTLFAAAAIARLKGKGCGVFNSDLRVRDGFERLYTYPDVSIVCGKPEFGESHTLALRNGCVPSIAWFGASEGAAIDFSRSATGVHTLSKRERGSLLSGRNDRRATYQCRVEGNNRCICV